MVLASPQGSRQSFALAQVWAALRAELLRSRCSAGDRPRRRLCGGSFFSPSEAAVCLVQQHAGALCTRGQLQSGLKLDLLRAGAS